MNIISAKATVTHIISGFLGAGKTTVLQHLLTQKPAHERWAVLMNEFGQIGVDQLFLSTGLSTVLSNELSTGSSTGVLSSANDAADFHVKEVLGGCLCCTSQLPLQIALARLLSDYKPDRLFIEPTGLGHPAQLLQQLTEPHWHNNLSMRRLVTVIDGSRLNEDKWSQQSLYQDQIKAAQMVLVSHADRMTAADDSALNCLKTQYAEYAQQWQKISHGHIALSELDVAFIAPKRQMRPLLSQRRHLPNASSITRSTTESISNATAESFNSADGMITQLPYHYVEQAQDYAVAGWRLPKSWKFEHDAMLDLLCTQHDFLRLKAILHSSQGWQYFNCNPQQFNFKSGEASLDNRIEIIYPKDAAQDWTAFEACLLAARCDTV